MTLVQNVLKFITYYLYHIIPNFLLLSQIIYTRIDNLYSYNIINKRVYTRNRFKPGLDNLD